MDPLNNQRGIALLLTLVVLVLLVTVIVEFDYGTKINLITAGNFRDGVRATYLAKSGVAAARAALKDDAIKEGKHDDLTEFWAQPLAQFPVGEGFVSVLVTDEASKINLNQLADTRTTVRDDARRVLKRLFFLLELDPELVSAIQDWVDSDDSQEDQAGAEAPYYQRLDPPYQCKNSPMDTLSELLLVRGITPEIYETLRPFLTTVSVEGSNGNGLININTAELQVLQSLDEDISEDFARRIRDGRPYEKVSEFYTVTNAAGVGGMNKPMARQIGVTSRYFTVVSRGQMYGTEKIVKAMIERKGKKTELLSWEIK